MHIYAHTYLTGSWRAGSLVCCSYSAPVMASKTAATTNWDHRWARLKERHFPSDFDWDGRTAPAMSTGLQRAGCNIVEIELWLERRRKCARDMCQEKQTHLLGAVELEGFADGCDVGCEEALGREEGWLDGAALNEGASLGLREGCELTLGTSEGPDEGCELG